MARTKPAVTPTHPRAAPRPVVTVHLVFNAHIGPVVAVAMAIRNRRGSGDLPFSPRRLDQRGIRAGERRHAGGFDSDAAAEKPTPLQLVALVVILAVGYVDQSEASAD